jgi:organic radical activating enzyme
MQIKQFDVHLSHACNFTCDSCSHYSNYHFSGSLSLPNAEDWYRQWSPRVEPKRINVLGGEPALNPNMSEHLLLVRKYFPRTVIYLYTNGFLLHRHSQLPHALRDAGNCIVKLSRHYNSDDYMKRFQEVVRMLEQWHTEFGAVFEISDSYTKWTRRYLDEGGNITPFHDENPRQSWEICNARWCLQLHEGKMWKCPILAYLPMLKKKKELSPEWDFYLTYKPLEPTCSEEELHEFLSRHDEAYCSACPAFKRHFAKNDPTRRVAVSPGI